MMRCRKCATNDGDAPDAQSTRVRSDPSERRGQIEIDRSRLAAAACECHDTLRLVVEEVFAMNPARSRVLVMPDDAIGESGDAM
jgi:hypothetical protein